MRPKHRTGGNLMFLFSLTGSVASTAAFKSWTAGTFYSIGRGLKAGCYRKHMVYRLVESNYVCAS